MSSKATEQARGYLEDGGKIQIAVRVSEGVFKELKMRAVQEGRSIAEQIRDYIQVGLEVDRDWDADREADVKAAQVTIVDVSRAPTLQQAGSSSEWVTEKDGRMEERRWLDESAKRG